MVELQILNKVLKEKSLRLLKENDITEEYFLQYKDEYDYIIQHINDYANVPDIETVVAKFPEFDILNVQESDDYLVNTFREEYLYNQSVPLMNKMAELLQTDSYKAFDYLKANIDNIKVAERVKGVDIISEAKSRYEEWEETRKNKDTRFIPSGFEELDEEIGGFHKGEELVVLFARTGQGKSWVLIKMLEHAWKVGKLRVGMIEPEMSANRTGYRFDTVHKHISSRDLYRGNDIAGYSKYIEKLSKNEVPFYVAHPRHFNKEVTVSKLKNWCETNKLDILAVDGISYLKDERAKRGDNKTTQLTNISEDLMQLSIDLKIPVIVVVQSNRLGTQQEDLELENIRDSDGISYNASLVISIQQKETGLQLAVKKARNSNNHTKLVYMWDADRGTFDYIPQEGRQGDEEKANELRRRYNDSTKDGGVF